MREDDVCTLASAQRAMTIIGAASKRLVVLDDSYHMIIIDNDRQRVVEELIAFSTAHSVAHEPEALCPTLSTELLTLIKTKFGLDPASSIRSAAGGVRPGFAVQGRTAVRH
jgi:hypothetical protein